MAVDGFGQQADAAILQHIASVAAFLIMPVCLFGHGQAVGDDEAHPLPCGPQRPPHRPAALDAPAIGRDPDLPGGACLTRDAQRRYQVMSSHPAVVGLRPSEPGTRNNDTIVFGRIEDIRRMAKLINQKPQDEIESDVRFPKISQPDKLLDAENIVSSSNVTEFKKTALAW